MKENKSLTAGETAPVEATATVKAEEVNKMADLSAINKALAAVLVSVGDSFKKIGGTFVSLGDMTKFLDTLSTLSSVGMYDTIITVDGVAYPLSAYTVDSRIAAAFVMPRAVVMPGSNPFRKDVSVHHSAKKIMTPAEMIEFEYKLFAYFKVSPNLVSVEESIRPVMLGDVTEVMKGDMCHIEDLASVKSLPVSLKISDELYGEGYFNYRTADVLRMIAVNFYSGLK